MMYNSIIFNEIPLTDLLATILANKMPNAKVRMTEPRVCTTARNCWERRHGTIEMNRRVRRQCWKHGVGGGFRQQNGQHQTGKTGRKIKKSLIFYFFPHYVFSGPVAGSAHVHVTNKHIRRPRLLTNRKEKSPSDIAW
jgi:hypothetical protein